MRRTWAETVDLVLASTCAGCGDAGPRVCLRCREEVLAAALPPEHVVTPRPLPAGWPGASATVAYEGVVARLITAYKDGERRDLRPVLARLLADALCRGRERLVGDTGSSGSGPRRGFGDSSSHCSGGGAGAGIGPVLLVPAPSARRATRARGDRPVADLVRAAAAASASPVGEVRGALRLTRPVRDQATLGGDQRRSNLAAAMTCDPASVRGRTCLLVDDVVTSGATLTEGRRTLLEAGAAEVGLVALAATPLRSPRPSR